MYTVLNNAYATVATQSNSGATTVALTTGQGSRFSSASTTSPVRVGVFDTSTSPETLRFFAEVTGVSTDTLTLANRGAESTSDANILVGDTIAAVVTAQIASDALNAGGGDQFHSGYFSFPFPFTGTPSNVALTLNRQYWTPFFVPARRAFDRIGIYVTTAATTGGLVRLGIYTNTNAGPGALVVDAGTVAADSTGSKEATISQTLSPGWWWLSVVAQVAAPNVAWCPTGSMALGNTQITVAQQNGSIAFPIKASSVTGALPSTAAPDSTASPCPLVMLRAA